MASVLAGLGAGLSLIIAIGAQNAFVLRQGLRGEHVFVVVVTCALSDVILISVGTSSLSAIAGVVEWAIPVITWAGVIFLGVYGGLSVRRAVKGEVLTEAEGPGASWWATLATCVGLTWLNPHVYLDTVLLLGSLATAHQPHQWWFALGAMAGSCLWFTFLGYAARWLRPIFASPRAWRILDIVIALTMWAIAVSLILRLL